MKLSIVVNCTLVGVSMDLHGYRDEPLMLELIRPAQLTQFRRTLEKTNPDMAHACMGQVALILGQRMYPELPVSLAR